MAGTVRPHGLVPLSWMGGKGVVDTMKGTVKLSAVKVPVPGILALSPNPLLWVAAAGGDKASRTVGVVGGREFG